MKELLIVLQALATTPSIKGDREVVSVTRLASSGPARFMVELGLPYAHGSLQNACLVAELAPRAGAVPPAVRVDSLRDCESLRNEWRRQLAAENRDQRMNDMIDRQHKQHSHDGAEPSRVDVSDR